MNEALRASVRDRARGRCEYCLYPEAETLIPHQLDHVVARQHGGADDAANLALCCAVCNRYKGPNLSSIDPRTNEVIRNPVASSATESSELTASRPLLKAEKRSFQEELV